MNHYIYKINCKSGKYYIGRHSTQNMEDGYMGSGKWVKSLKYKRLLSKQVLEFCDSFEVLLIKEKQYILEHINDDMCMNFNNEPVGFATGDLNPAKSESERKRRSIRVSQNNPSKNPETAKKISESLKGKPNKNKGIPLSDDAKKNISEGRVGIKYSEEGKTKIKEARIRDYYSGHRGVPSFTGMTHNDDTKEKQRNSALSRKRVTCPQCQKHGAVNVMVRWHFDNCKLKIEDMENK